MSIKAVQGYYLTYYQIMATNNPCYKRGVQRSKTTRLILHSVGCNNAWLRRWISPDDGQIGDDGVTNGWNVSNADTLVHFVIGLDKNGVSRAYQMAPFGLRVWGCGSGSKGSGNDIAVQVEMTEDSSMGAKLAKSNYAVAVNLFASLCKYYGLSASAIWSHKEAHDAGYASNHGDPESWWRSSGSGLTMDGFRRDVQAVLTSGVPYGGSSTAGDKPTQATTPSTGGQLYRVRRTWTDAASQLGAYADLDNAKAACKAGYSVFDAKGNAVYTPGGTAQGERPTAVQTYRNGSTTEPVYADTGKQTKIGSLSPWEQCDCLGTVDGMYIVRYQVDGTSAHKVGVVAYSGGCA